VKRIHPAERQHERSAYDWFENESGGILSLASIQMRLQVVAQASSH